MSFKITKMLNIIFFVKTSELINANDNIFNEEPEVELVVKKMLKALQVAL